MSKATAPLADYVGVLGPEPVILTSRGKPIAALVSLRGTDAEAFALGANPRFLALIERSRKRQAREGGVSSKALRQKLGLRKNGKSRG